MRHAFQVKPLENIGEMASDKIEGNVQLSDKRTFRDSVASGVNISGVEHICKQDCSLRR